MQNPAFVFWLCGWRGHLATPEETLWKLMGKAVPPAADREPSKRCPASCLDSAWAQQRRLCWLVKLVITAVYVTVGDPDKPRHDPCTLQQRYSLYSRVVGTCRWTGYDFPVITIDTGYLNRPIWLLAGYSVYHRVAYQPTMFMTGLRSRHQQWCMRDATDFYECMMIHSRIESPSMSVPMISLEVVITQNQGLILVGSPIYKSSFHLFLLSNNRSGYIRGVQYCRLCSRVCIWKFLVRYIVTGCLFCAPSGLRQGQVFTPRGTPYPFERWVPPPPPPGHVQGKGIHLT